MTYSVPVMPTVRVLHVFMVFRPDYTGEGIYVEALQSRLRPLGVEADVVAVATAEPPLPTAPGPFGRVVRLGGRGHEMAGLIRLWRWLRENLRHYDLVHFHSVVDRYFIAPILCRSLGRPVVLSCTLDDGAAEYLASYRNAYRPLVTRLLRSVDLFLAISPRLYHDCLQAVPAERVVLIPQGVATPPPCAATTAELRRDLGCRPDEFTLLYVGGICGRKGVEVLVEALPGLVRAVPNVALHMVGPEMDNGLASELLARTAAMGLAGRLRFHGAVPDPTPWYRAADVLVFASRREGFGNVLLEAMACGLPVVARRLPGVNDFFIDHGDSGALWDDGDELVAWVKRLASDPGLRRHMGAAARRRALGSFALERIATQYALRYAALLPCHTPRLAALPAPAPRPAARVDA